MRLRTPFLLLAAALLAGPAAEGQMPQAQRRARSVLDSPARAAVNAAGELLITDTASRRVCKVAADGRTVRSSFHTASRPVALGVIGGRVFVGLPDEHRVAIYGSGGHELGTLGGAGFQVDYPLDIETDAAASRLYLLDGLGKQVLVFDATTLEGVHVATIGQAGPSLGDLEHPSALALDPQAQEVFVADFGSLGGGHPARVLVFGFDGSLHKTISGDGGPTGQYFGRPQGLVIGASGNLFVVDGWRGEVVIMDRSTAAQVDVLGSYGKDPGELLLPLDAVRNGPDDDLHVVCNRTRRIEVFAKGGQK